MQNKIIKGCKIVGEVDHFQTPGCFLWTSYFAETKTKITRSKNCCGRSTTLLPAPPSLKKQEDTKLSPGPGNNCLQPIFVLIKPEWGRGMQHNFTPFSGICECRAETGSICFDREVIFQCIFVCLFKNIDISMQYGRLSRCLWNQVKITSKHVLPRKAH